MAEQVFDALLQENIKNKLPLSESEILIQYKSAKKLSLQEFEKK